VFGHADEIRRRLDRMEREQEQITKRLQDGAAAFEEVRKGLAETNEAVHKSHEHLKAQIQPKPVPGWKVLSMAFGIACVIGGWVWSLARYPDRDEFTAAQQAIGVEQQAMRLEVSKVKVKQVNLGHDVQLIRSSVERQERTQEKLERKLDKVLDLEQRR
jgi:hypothetical protein